MGLGWNTDCAARASGRLLDRDRRILSLIAAGQSNKEIARELNVTPGAVTARLLAVYKRLKISRRSEAVRYFVQWEQDCLGVGIARSNNHLIMVSHRSNT